MYKQLMERRAALIDQAKAIAQRGVAANRDLTADEQTEFDGLISDVEAIDKRAKEIREGEQRPHELEESFRSVTGVDPRAARRGHMLNVPAEVHRELTAAVNERKSFSWQAEERAALQTGIYGTTTGWHASGADGPLLLHDVGGAAVEQLTGLGLQYPVWTLPSASAAVGETVSLGEYASTTLGQLAAARYGRWTSISQEAHLTGTAGVTRLHGLAIARDLNAACITAMVSGLTPVVFATSAEFMIKRAIATVCDVTASEPGALMLCVNPADAPLVSDTSPTDGADVASTVERFSGARLFMSSAVNTGHAIVANMGVGVVYGSAQPIRVETDFDVKTGVTTIGSSVIGGYGVGIPQAIQVVDIVA